MTGQVPRRQWLLVVGMVVVGCRGSRSTSPSTTSTPAPSGTIIGLVHVPPAKAEEADAGAAGDGGRARRPRLPPAEIQKRIRARYDDLRRCYERGLARNPTLAGKVVARFVIGRDGIVSNASTHEHETTLADTEAIECMLDVYRDMTFPKPDGGIVTVVYPIVFSPADEDASAP